MTRDMIELMGSVEDEVTPYITAALPKCTDAVVDILRMSRKDMARDGYGDRIPEFMTTAVNSVSLSLYAAVEKMLADQLEGQQLLDTLSDLRTALDSALSRLRAGMDFAIGCRQEKP